MHALLAFVDGHKDPPLLCCCVGHSVSLIGQLKKQSGLGRELSFSRLRMKQFLVRVCEPFEELNYFIPSRKKTVSSSVGLGLVVFETVGPPVSFSIKVSLVSDYICVWMVPLNSGPKDG